MLIIETVERISRRKTPPKSLSPLMMLIATIRFHPRGDAMRCFFLTLIVSVSLAAMTTAQAGHRSHGYQRSYGNPWHGAGMYSGNHVGHYHNGYGGSSFSGYGYRGGWGVPSYGYGYGGYGLGGVSGFGSYSRFGLGGYGLGGYGYSNYYNSTTFLGPGYGVGGYGAAGYWGSPFVSYPLGVPWVQPTLTLQSPGVYTPYPSDNPLFNQALLNNGFQWQQEVPGLLAPQVETLGVEPLGRSSVLPPPSSAEAKLRGVQLQQQGDARMRELDYLQASMRYQDSIGAAADRVEPHYRLAISQAGMKRFDKAVSELKRATEIDPTWVNAITLDELLGGDNLIGKTQLKQRVADWALADAHDADRLYLLGTLLYLDGNVDKARILFDTAVALVGNEPYLSAFLTPLANTNVVAPELPAPPPDGTTTEPAPTEATPP